MLSTIANALLEANLNPGCASGANVSGVRVPAQSFVAKQALMQRVLQ